MSSNTEKKILNGDVRALKDICVGKNASEKAVNFSLSLPCLKLQQGRVKSGVFFCLVWGIFVPNEALK